MQTANSHLLWCGFFLLKSAEILPLLRSHMADKTTAEALIRAVLREIGRR